MESLSEIYHKLNQLGYSLVPFHPKDEGQLYDIFRHIIDTGGQFPFQCNSKQEFHRQFLNAESHVYICHLCEEVIGGFYIKSNLSDRSNSIANAAYMLQEKYRGQGIGTLLI